MLSKKAVFFNSYAFSKRLFFRIIKVPLIFVLFGIPTVHADVVVIVNKASPLSTLSKDDIRSIFLGKLHVYPTTDVAVTPLDLNNGSKSKAVFYNTVANKSLRKMNSYWARSLFTGKGRPPRALSSDAEVIRAVAESKHHIGYIDGASVDGSVIVAFTINE